MVTVRRHENWKITIYPADHGIPHFHIEGPDFRCSIGIRTRELIIGSAPRQVLAAALRWARENEEVLAATWKELNG